VRPDLGKIENVVTELLGLLRSHGLNINSPTGVVSALDRFDQGLDTVIGVLTSELASSSVVKSLEALVGAKVDLDVMVFAFGVHELEGMTRVTVHLMVAIGSSTVGEENEDLMNRLRVLRQVIPEHIRVLQVSLGVTLLGVDEMGEFGGVTEEEDGSVVEDPIPIALFCSDLDGESSGIASGIGGSRFTADS